ncbi:hypothetical protein C8F04DRAFT_1258436 [Mycena alexandri]|uniref:Uncharacterized protein n=1 Tax=Mycena alexandri TaxID=1745969 RepID=A0AAD6SYA8_9AGAR|nr:hypothetical protein C8F04DRAFT_1258436 [Mycena alexandri]
MAPAKTASAPRRAVPVGQVARKRTRKKATGVKPGKVSWVHGTKLVFFEKRGEEWKVANDLGVVQLGRFYTKVTNLYLLKYGHEMQDSEDLEVDVEDPTDPDAVLPGSDNLSEEEAKTQSDNMVRVRKRIAQWYCRKYRGVEQADKELFADLVGGVANTGPDYPRKAQPIHLYSRKYYEERVKTRFEKAWETEKKTAEALEREPEAEIKIRNAATREAFEEETVEFREELVKAVEVEHLAAIRAWELTRAETPSKTAAEINAALKNAAFYLEPLADAISAKFGMNCSILLCGPIGDRGGGIDVRSVHAGTTKGLTPQKWHQFDKMGYDATVKSFVRFSERCFSEEECLSRIVDGASTSTSGSIVSTVLPSARREERDPTAASQTDGAAANQASGASTQGRMEMPASSQTDGGAAGGEDGGSAGGEDGGSAGGEDGGSAGREDGGSAGGEGGSGGGQLGGDAGASRAGGAGDVDGSGDGEGAGGEKDDGAGGDGAVRPEDLPVWTPDADAWKTWSPEVMKAFASFATSKAQFGEPWASLVDAWVKVEEASGFDNEGGKLTTEGRPKEVTAFINNGRHWIMVRKIDAPGSKEKAGSYAARWWAWWAAIEAKGELHTMHGRMGFMLVVLSLLWWGAGDLGGEWEAAVAAVTTTLEEVVRSGKIAKKTAPLAPGSKRAGKKGQGKRTWEEKGNDGEEDEEQGEEDEEQDERERRSRSKRQKKGGEAETSERVTRARATTGRPRPRPRPLTGGRTGGR